MDDLMVALVTQTSLDFPIKSAVESDLISRSCRQLICHCVYLIPCILFQNNAAYIEHL